VNGIAPDSIFHYSDHRAFLTDLRARYPGCRRPIRLDAWAKRLGYRSPRTVAMVLKGQRLPSSHLIQALSADIGLTAPGRRYLELLVKKRRWEKAKRPVDAIERELDEIIPRHVHDLKLDSLAFSLISNWYCLVISRLMGAEGVEPDAKGIARQLRGKVTPGQVRDTLKALVRLGVAVIDPDSGRIRLPNPDFSITTQTDIPSASIRRHHSEMLQRALEALEEQPVPVREFTALTLRVDKARMAEMKTWIREFRDRFSGTFGRDRNASVYQLNIQLFEHTETPC
jgi:uncharacterized protein (TIGR02147 family)